MGFLYIDLNYPAHDMHLAVFLVALYLDHGREEL